MKYLLKTGLTPNVQNLSSKTFPLLFASERKCYGSLKLMFKYKINFSLRDYQKQSAIMKLKDCFGWDFMKVVKKHMTQVPLGSLMFMEKGFKTSVAAHYISSIPIRYDDV